MAIQREKASFFGPLVFFCYYWETSSRPVSRLLPPLAVKSFIDYHFSLQYFLWHFESYTSIGIRYDIVCLWCLLNVWTTDDRIDLCQRLTSLSFTFVFIGCWTISPCTDWNPLPSPKVLYPPRRMGLSLESCESPAVFYAVSNITAHFFPFLFFACKSIKLK